MSHSVPFIVLNNLTCVFCSLEFKYPTCTWFFFSSNRELAGHPQEWARKGVFQKREEMKQGRVELKSTQLSVNSEWMELKVERKKQKEKNMEAEAGSNHKVFGRACLYPIGNEEFL